MNQLEYFDDQPQIQVSATSDQRDELKDILVNATDSEIDNIFNVVQAKIQEAVDQNSEWNYENVQIVYNNDMGWIGGEIRNTNGDLLKIFVFKEDGSNISSPNVELSIHNGPTIHYNEEHEEEERMWVSDVAGVEYEFGMSCEYLEEFMSQVRDTISRKLATCLLKPEEGIKK